jgi:hypothetical protein
MSIGQMVVVGADDSHGLRPTAKNSIAENGGFKKDVFRVKSYCG